MSRRNLLVPLLLTCLTACAGGVPPISEKAVVYNQQVAAASNEIFLLNTVRAAKYLPRCYTRFTGLTAEGSITGRVATPLEFGPDAAQIFKVLPDVTGSQKDTTAISVLDDQKFTNGVLTPIPDSTLKFYLDQGWPAELLFTLALERIEIGPAALNSLTDGLEKVCADRANQFDIYCRGWKEIRNDLGQCERRRGPVLQMDNSPRGDGTDLRCFQATLRALLAAGLQAN
jgi:hypothetical protein